MYGESRESCNTLYKVSFNCGHINCGFSVDEIDICRMAYDDVEKLAQVCTLMMKENSSKSCNGQSSYYRGMGIGEYFTILSILISCY